MNAWLFGNFYLDVFVMKILLILFNYVRMDAKQLWKKHQCSFVD